MKRAHLTVAALLLSLIVAAPAPAANPEWRLEQPPPPAGGQLKTPLGTPGDMQFLAPNRGLLAVAGNGSTVPPGLFSYDGAGWHQLSTVCGGPDDSVKIAFAGPREFWTVTEPSRPRFGPGTALCHFRDGQVVASYSTPPESSDPFRQMLSAACLGPDDCWFGGVGSQDATGERVGAFHLHWNGSVLRSVYAPQGRAVSDMEAQGGVIHETVVVGPGLRDLGRPTLAEPEHDPLDPDPDPDPDLRSVRPRLIHQIAGGQFFNDPFVVPGDPGEGSDLLAIDGDGSRLWAVGGGAASGPAAAAQGGFVPRAPLALRRAGGVWSEVPLDPAGFDFGERLIDVSAVPGADSAWAAVGSVSGPGSVNAPAKVVRLEPDGTTSAAVLPSATGVGRGSAAKIAFTGPNDGWMVTSAGWLFHYTDGSLPAPNLDPAFQGTITFRPNEAAEQFVPDRPPVDDSELFRPPPLEVEQPDAPARVRRLSPLLRRVRSSLRGRSLVVRFVLTREARVALIARRKGRVVARTRAKTMRPGRHVLRLRLDRRRWPQRLSFTAREPGVAPGGGSDGGGDGDTITTGL